jgi:hypothetical protein
VWRVGRAFSSQLFESIKSRSQQSSVYCAACVAFNYKQEFVDMVYSDLMSISLSLESEIMVPQRHVKLGQQYLKSMKFCSNLGSIICLVQNKHLSSHRK